MPATPSLPARALRHTTSSLLPVRPPAGEAVRALRVAGPAVVGLLVASVVFGPTHGAMGLVGALGASVGRGFPLRRRLLTMAVVFAVTMTGAAVGAAIGPHVWLVPPVMTAMTLAGVWCWQALRIGPPGPTTMLFALVFGQHAAATGHPARLVLPVLATAWLAAALASLLLLALDVHAPVRDAVAQAEQAVRAYRDHRDDRPPAEVDELRHAAHQAVEEAWTAWHGHAVWGLTRRPALEALRERLATAHLALVELLPLEGRPSGPGVADVIESAPQGRPPARYLLRAAASLASRPWLVAARAALAVLLASSLMVASPLGRPYWAVLSALIVLHVGGATRTELTLRGVHRVVGTAVGVLVYLVVVQAHAGPWLRLAVVAAAIYLMQLFIGRNYALGVVFVTVYALLLVPPAAGSDIGGTTGERVLETAIGVLASLVAIWFVGRRAPVLLVRGQYRRTLHAIGDVLADQACGHTTSSGAVERRRDLLYELNRATEVLASQRQEDPDLSRWQGAGAAVAHLGVDVLGRSWHHLAGPDAAAAQARRSLGRLVAALPPISTTDIDAGALQDDVEALHREYLHRPTP